MVPVVPNLDVGKPVWRSIIVQESCLRTAIPHKAMQHPALKMGQPFLLSYISSVELSGIGAHNVFPLVPDRDRVTDHPRSAPYFSK